MQTEDQKRAKFALGEVNRRMNQSILTKEDANFLVGLPTQVFTNGLGQTLAFLASKFQSDSRHEFGYRLIIRYINNFEEKKFLDTPSPAAFESLMKMNSDDYLRIQKETLAMLAWVKRYAKAFCEEKK